MDFSTAGPLETTFIRQQFRELLREFLLARPSINRGKSGTTLQRQGGDTVDHTDGRKSFGRLMLSQARKVIRSNFEGWLFGIREVEDLWVDCLNLVPLRRALAFFIACASTFTRTNRYFYSGIQPGLLVYTTKVHGKSAR